MFRRILVALDGSSRAEQAIPVAARLARAAGGTALLVHVIRGALEFEVGAVPPAVWAPPAVPRDRERAQAYLRRVAASDQLAGVATETGVYAGPTAATLLFIAHELKADLIVMTTRGLTGLKRWALGSVAEKVAHESAMPVLLLHERDAPMLPSTTLVERPCALVTLDGSAFAEAAIMPAASLVRTIAAPEVGALHLLWVLDEADSASIAESHGDQPSTPAAAQQWALSQAREYLAATAARIRDALGSGAPTVTWSVVENPQFGTYESDVAGAILRTAESGESVAGATAPARCNLIAMASHGRGGLTHWILGSITLRVLHSTNLPMLVVRPAAVPHRTTVD